MPSTRSWKNNALAAELNAYEYCTRSSWLDVLHNFSSFRTRFCIQMLLPLLLVACASSLFYPRALPVPCGSINICKKEVMIKMQRYLCKCRQRPKWYKNSIFGCMKKQQQVLDGISFLLESFGHKYGKRKKSRTLSSRRIEEEKERRPTCNLNPELFYVAPTNTSYVSESLLGLLRIE